MNQDNERLDELRTKLHKAERVLDMAEKRRREKYDIFRKVLDEYVCAVRGFHTPNPIDVANRWKAAMDRAEKDTSPLPRSLDAMGMVVSGSIPQPSVEAIAYHFEVGRAEAEAILDYANSHGDDLNAIIHRGDHRRPR